MHTELFHSSQGQYVRRDNQVGTGCALPPLKTLSIWMNFVTRAHMYIGWSASNRQFYSPRALSMNDDDYLIPSLERKICTRKICFLMGIKKCDYFLSAKLVCKVAIKLDYFNEENKNFFLIVPQEKMQEMECKCNPFLREA